MWRFKKLCFLVLLTILVPVLLLASLLFVAALADLGAGNTIALAADPCEGCAGTYNAWKSAEDYFFNVLDADDLTDEDVNAYMLAKLRYEACVDLGCDTGDGSGTGDIIVTDSDGDGVLDDVDDCPGTAPGTAVDVTGCPLGMQLSVFTDKEIYSPGEAVVVTGSVSGANGGLAGVSVVIAINPQGSTTTNASGNYRKVLTLPSDISQGNHTVTVTASRKGYPDVTQTKRIAIGSLLVTASTDKPDNPVYVTNETITITGDLAFGGEPVDWAPISIEVHRADGTTDEEASVTERDGSYTIRYVVPRIPFETIPSAPEEWEIKVMAKYSDGGKTTTAFETVTVKILPIYLKLHHVQLVQVIDRISCLPNSQYPDGELRVPSSEQPIFIAGKQAGIRTVISCPSLETVEGVTPFQVTVKLRSTGPNALSQEKEVTVTGGELVSADFLFTLPAGVVSIWIQVDPDEQYVEASDDLKADIINVTVAQPHKSLKLKFVAIDLRMSFSPDWATPMEREFFVWCEEQVRFMRQVYPLPPSRITYGIAVADAPQRAKTSRLVLSLWLGNMAQQEGLALALKNVLLKNVGVLPDSWWGSGESGCAFALAQRSACLVKYRSPLEAVTAHEVGHTLGLYVYQGLEQYQQFREWGLPVDHHIVLRNGALYNLLLEDEAIVAFPHPHVAAGKQAAEVYCFMGLATDANAAWVSKEVYSDLIRTFMDPPVSEVLYVSGIISNRGVVQLGDWYLLEAEPDPLVGELPGDYSIQCLSPSGEVLYTTEFGTDTEDVVFAFNIPFPTDTSRVAIKHGETTLHEVQKTPNSPTVSILYPNGSETLGETCEVRWRADDVDGDELSYAVLYSGDGGKDWTAVATNLLETQYTLALSELPGGDQCLLQVVAMDGFNVGHDESDAFFSVGDKTPFAFITSLEDGGVYPAGEEIWLQGIAYDLEDEASTGLTTEWLSSLDGVLGHAEELRVDSLSEGTHEIAFRVADSKGTTAEEKASITIRGGADLGNHLPSASFALMPDSPEVGDTIVVASTSSDPDGDLLTTSWYLNGEHLLEIDNQSDWEWTDVDAGEYTLTLRVEDGKGGTDENFKVIEVGAAGQESSNRPPAASFTIMPANPTPDDTIKATSTSFDPDGDPLIYSWYVNGVYAGTSGNLPEWTWPNPAEGEYTIGLVVMDGEGGIDEYSKVVTVVRSEWSSNHPPTASFALMPQDPEAGDTIMIVSTSSDPDGDMLTSSWYLDGEHLLELDNQSDWEWADAEAGEHTVALKIDDGRRGSDQYSMAVTVAGDDKDAGSYSSNKSNMLLYFLLIPIAAVVIFLASRRLRKK